MYVWTPFGRVGGKIIACRLRGFRIFEVNATGEQIDRIDGEEFAGTASGEYLGQGSGWVIPSAQRLPGKTSLYLVCPEGVKKDWEIVANFTCGEGRGVFGKRPPPSPQTSPPTALKIRVRGWRRGFGRGSGGRRHRRPRLWKPRAPSPKDCLPQSHLVAWAQFIFRSHFPCP